MSISQATSITIGGKRVSSIYIGGKLVYPLNRSYHWEDRTSPGSISSSINVWSDGYNTYFSSGGATLQLIDNEWSSKTFNINVQYGQYVHHSSWGDTYLLQDTSLYKLVNGVWVDEGLTDSMSRNGHLWDDGENLYYSFLATHERYNPTTHKFEQVYFTDSPLLSFRGEDVFRHDEKTYCGVSQGNIYMFDKTALTWVKSALSDSRIGAAQNIWKHHGVLYYSYDGVNLAMKNGVWTEIDIPYKNGSFNGRGMYVWHDKEDTYYSASRDQYVLI